MTLKHQVVTREQWVEARKALMEKEKAFLEEYDRLTAEARALPWVRVEKAYRFETTAGERTLAGLFDGRSQLVVVHFMFAPEWEEGCIGCSFGADHYNGTVEHLEHHDVSFVVVSRAPLEKLQAFRERMGWRFNWVSSLKSDFNYDYHVSFPKEQVAAGRIYYNYEWAEIPMEELHGTSLFYRDDAGQVFHTYSAYARGAEQLGGVYPLLDHLPKGRNENGPNFNFTDWVKLRDRYGVCSASGENGGCSSCGCDE